MQDLENMPGPASPGGDPRQWLTVYLKARARLASLESDFRCPPACTRPGCKDPDLQVHVSLVDLLGAALHLGESLVTIYRRHYSLGLFTNDRDDWIRTVALKLKKPCPFLEDDLCRIYPVRPMPCMLFPEYLVYQGKLEESAGKEFFRDYLCLHEPLQLAPARARVMGQLARMWGRESLISSFFLFNQGPCYLDFSNLIGELEKEAGSLKQGESGDRAGPGRYIPHQVLESFFLERIAVFPPFSGVSEKIQLLHTPEGQAQFLRLLADDHMFQKLRRPGDDRALIFRLVKGKLQARRRSLLPAAYKYC
jgi:Fe-S-cluster containining protein